MKLHKPLCVLLCMILVFSGCRGSSNKHVGVDISSDAGNLDPLFAEDPLAATFVMNLFEGLVVQDPSGAIHPGVAKSWTISADGLHYKFTLREDSLWADGSRAVDAYDFLFTFQRMFQKGAPSPYKEDFSVISGGESGSLGVVVNNPLEIEFRLQKPDPLLLEKLAGQAAMPCNEEFFKTTKGRYGLERKLLLGNGPFTLIRWDQGNRMTMNRNPHYRGETPVLLDAVDFYIGRDKPEDRFRDGKTDIYALASGQKKQYEDKGFTLKESSGSTWSLVFDTNSPIWGVSLLRQAMAYSIDRQQLGAVAPAENLFYEGIRVGDQSLVEDSTVLPYNPAKAGELSRLGLDLLGITRTKRENLWIPTEFYEDELFQPFITKWDQIGLVIVPTEISREELTQLVKAGDFGMALLPIESSTSRPEGILERFTVGNANNHSSYDNENYDILVESIAWQETAEEMKEKALQGEHQLLADAVVIPLFIEKNYYAVSKNAEGVDLYPFEGGVRFHPARTADEIQGVD